MMINMKNFGIISSRVHIVGNGPSWINFSKIENDDYIIGCNITKVDANITFMSDLQLVYKIREGITKINCPIVANKKVSDWLATEKGKQTNIQLFDTYSPDWERNEGPQLTSAHYATEYSIYKLGFKEVHIWGCDSLKENFTYSYTDEIRPSPTKDDINKVKENIEKWRAGWKTIEQKYSSTKIIFHNLISD